MLHKIKAYYLEDTEIVEIKGMKRKHEQTDFNQVVKIANPERKSHIVGKVTFLLWIEFRSELSCGEIGKKVLVEFGKELLNCLDLAPKSIFGDTN